MPGTSGVELIIAAMKDLSDAIKDTTKATVPQISSSDDMQMVTAYLRDSIELWLDPQ